MTASAVRGASWMSLLAATTLGVTGADPVRARISANGDLDDGDLRLIVQTYPRDHVDAAHMPGAHDQPLASIQRATTAEELREGVDVSFLELPGELAEDDSVVIAWVERGRPDLEFDALEARPPVGAPFGVARRSISSVELQLSRG